MHEVRRKILPFEDWSVERNMIQGRRTVVGEVLRVDGRVHPARSIHHACLGSSQDQLFDHVVVSPIWRTWGKKALGGVAVKCKKGRPADCGDVRGLMLSHETLWEQRQRRSMFWTKIG